MVEDLGKILGNGFNTWTDNLNICLPFVFNTVISMALFGVVIGTTIFLLLPSFLPYFENLEEISPESLPLLFSQILPSIGIIIITGIIFVILVLLVSAFFTSGAIGMAIKATKTGKCDLSDMIEFGKKKYVSFFFAELIVGLITFAGIVFMIPGISSIFSILTTIQNPTPEDFFMTLPVLVLGSIATGIYVLIVTLILYPYPYAVVIDDLGAVEGVKKGYRFFMDNKIDVFLLFIITVAISLILGFVVGSIPYIGGIINLVISLVVVQPLVTIWWSRFYLDVTGKLGSDSVESTKTDLIEQV